MTESNKGVRNLTKEMKGEMGSITLAFVWRNEQELHFRGISQPVMEKCRNTDSPIVAAKLSDKSLLLLHGEKNFAVIVGRKTAGECNCC
jgi:hypothetical protein